MHVCLLHPQTEAAGKCEYCAQPHCAECLSPFLGRRYCPACYGQVRALAHYPAAAAAPVAMAVPLGLGAPPLRAAPKWPGWASAAVYLFAFVVLMAVAEGGLGLSMILGRVLNGRAVPMKGVLQDVTGLGLQGWALLFGAWGWATLGAVLAVTAALARWLERRTLADLGLRLRVTFWRDLVVGTALAAVLFISVVGVGAGKGWYALYTRAGAVEALGITLAGFLILLPLAAVEEIAVRGYLMHALGRTFGRTGAVLVSSGAFALLHSLNPGAWSHPLSMLGIFLAGLYLASAYRITGNLWLAIFLHTGWNLLEGPIFGLPVSGISPPASVFQASDTGPVLWTGGKFGPEAGLLLCLLLVVHLAALWAMKPLLASREEAPVLTEAPISLAPQVGVGC